MRPGSTRRNIGNVAGRVFPTASEPRQREPTLEATVTGLTRAMAAAAQRSATSRVGSLGDDALERTNA